MFAILHILKAFIKHFSFINMYFDKYFDFVEVNSMIRVPLGYHEGVNLNHEQTSFLLSCVYFICVRLPKISMASLNDFFSRIHIFSIYTYYCVYKGKSRLQFRKTPFKIYNRFFFLLFFYSLFLFCINMR